MLALDPIAPRTLSVLLLHSDDGVRSRWAARLAAQLPGAAIEEAADSRGAVRSLSARRADLVVAPAEGFRSDAHELAQILRRNPVLAKKPLLLLGPAEHVIWSSDDPFARVLDPSATGPAWADCLLSLLGERLAPPAAPLAAASGGTATGILILSTGNAIRGPLAEALLRKHLRGVVVRSCGHKGLGIHPLALQAAAEWGLDLSTQGSRSLRETDVSGVGMTINLCFGEPGPMVPGRLKRLDWPTADPLRGGGDDDALGGRIRAARDGLLRRAERLAVELRTTV